MGDVRQILRVICVGSDTVRYIEVDKAYLMKNLFNIALLLSPSRLPFVQVSGWYERMSFASSSKKISLRTKELSLCSYVLNKEIALNQTNELFILFLTARLNLIKRIASIIQQIIQKNCEIRMFILVCIMDLKL